MAGQTGHGAELWRLARRQHGVVTRKQLLELGITRHGIEHRVSRGRLHRLHRGVFVVGRPELTMLGRYMAAVLACGPEAVISHQTAAQHWGMRAPRGAPIEISAPLTVKRNPRAIRLHRRRSLESRDRTVHMGVPVTTPVRTLVDLATRLGYRPLEAAISEADKLDLIDPDSLRAALEERSGQPGAPALRDVLDRRTFRLTDSELERRFLALVRSARLPQPDTGHKVNGFRVDFYWRELGLIVETDGLRYHRTPTQQARDRIRDQVHTAAGLTTLRFTHSQVRFEGAHVRRTVREVARRLASSP